MAIEHPIIPLLAQHGVLPSTPDDEIGQGHLVEVLRDAPDVVGAIHRNQSSLEYVMEHGFAPNVVHATISAAPDVAALNVPHACFLAMIRDNEGAIVAIARSGLADFNEEIHARTLLACAISFGFAAAAHSIIENVKREMFSVLEALLAAGAQPNFAVDHIPWNQAAPKGTTALHTAAGDGSVRAIEILIASGADVNHTNSRGEMPQHVAAASCRFSAARALLAGGADPLALDLDGKTPLVHVWAKPDKDDEERRNASAIITALVVAGERQWGMVPIPCPVLERALPVVWKDAPEELPEIFNRLEPHWQGVVRATLLPLHRWGLPTELRIKIMRLVVGDIKDIEVEEDEFGFC